MPFDRGDRTYYVSDERLKTFKALSTLEKLRWQEEIATFILLTRQSNVEQSGSTDTNSQAENITPPSA
jgi:hypothetical protein